MGAFSGIGGASTMDTLDNRLSSSGSCFGEGILRYSADARRLPVADVSTCGLTNEGEPGLDVSDRCNSEAGVLDSSLGAFGVEPYGRSRSSAGSSRLAGMEGARLFRFSPGLTHCMLFGGTPSGIRDPEKPGRSEGGYMDGLAAIGLFLSALGPVGMLAGKDLGEVLLLIPEDGPLPLVLRAPIVGCIAPGDASLDTFV